MNRHTFQNESNRYPFASKFVPISPLIFQDVLVGSCWRQKKYDEDENVPPNVPPIYDILVSEGNAGEGLASFALENNS